MEKHDPSALPADALLNCTVRLEPIEATPSVDLVVGQLYLTGWGALVCSLATDRWRAMWEVEPSDDSKIEGWDIVLPFTCDQIGLWLKAIWQKYLSWLEVLADGCQLFDSTVEETGWKARLGLSPDLMLFTHDAIVDCIIAFDLSPAEPFSLMISLEDKRFRSDVHDFHPIEFCLSPVQVADQICSTIERFRR